MPLVQKHLYLHPVVASRSPAMADSRATLISRMWTEGAHLDEVLGRQRLMDGDGEGQGVLLICVLPLQQEVLKVQDVLAVAVLHDDPEGLHPPVDLLIPLEVWCDGQVHLHIARLKA